MEEQLDKVREAFKAAFGVDPQSVTVGTKPADIPAWDSLGHVSLVSHLERNFGLSFDVDEVMEMENVSQILKILQSKTGSQKP